MMTMNYLRKLRFQNCLYSRELASKSGMDSSMISYLESGKRKMSVEQAVKLAKPLGVEWSDLLHEMRPDLFKEVE